VLFTVVLFAFNARSNPYLAGTLVFIAAAASEPEASEQGSRT
jgi:hypothetical protein